MIEINKIYNENCLDTMKVMPNNFIDLTITSPPYDELRDYNGFSFEFEKIAKELYRITKSGGVLVWIVGDSVKNKSETLTSFKQVLFFNEIGFNVHDTMIYHKAGFPFPDKTRYNQVFEYMFILSKGRPKTINLIKDRKNKYIGCKVARKTGERAKNGTLKENSAFRKNSNKRIEKFGIRDNVWYYAIGRGNSTKDDIAFKHPATFPEKLVKDHIFSWSNENELIYDPFMGSGTTAKMAFILKRKYIGSEISEEYCKIAKKRLNSYEKQMQIF